MTCKSLFRTAALTVAAGACAAVIGTSLPAHAQQLQVLGASPAVEDSAPQVAVSQRLILHDVRLRGANPVIDPSSRPVLDYAARVLKQYPETMVYVSGEGDSATARRQSQVVAHYLKRRGIAADRLMVSNSATVEPAARVGTVNGNTARDTGVIVLNLTSANCGTCS
jgi:outer membrane protein OmpA-like peptidoglycan-associated protein